MSVVEYKTETGSERGAIWEEKMAIWLIRAGSHGEYEQKFIQEGRVYVTWDELNLDLRGSTVWRLDFGKGPCFQ